MTPDQNFQNFHNDLMLAMASDRPYLQAKDPDAAPLRWFVYTSPWTESAVSDDRNHKMKLAEFHALLDAGHMRPCVTQSEPSGVWYEETPASLADLLKLHQHTAATIHRLTRYITAATNAHRSCSGEQEQLTDLLRRYAAQTTTLQHMQAATC